MSGTRSEAEQRGAAPVIAVRPAPWDDDNDWTAGYAEGKGAYETAAAEHRTAGAYLKATAQVAGRSHAWIDGFKSGWSVARDDRPFAAAYRLAS